VGAGVRTGLLLVIIVMMVLAGLAAPVLFGMALEDFVGSRARPIVEAIGLPGTLAALALFVVSMYFLERHLQARHEHRAYQRDRTIHVERPSPPPTVGFRLLRVLSFVPLAMAALGILAILIFER
jgi:hypothetical protein